MGPLPSLTAPMPSDKAAVLALTGVLLALTTPMSALTGPMLADGVPVRALAGAVLADAAPKSDGKAWKDLYVNDFSRKSSESLISFITQLLSAAQSTPTTFGWTAAELTALAGAKEAAQEAIDSQRNAQAMEKSATAAKNAAKATMVKQLGRLATEAYLDPEVDDTLLHQVGLSPRRSGSTRPALPQTVKTVVAVPNADGTVRLSYDRHANSERALYQIEASADGASWAQVTSTPRGSLTLGGFAPGVARWLRVTTVNASFASLPSASVAVYAPAAAPAQAPAEGAPEAKVKLRLAA